MKIAKLVQAVIEELKKKNSAASKKIKRAKAEKWEYAILNRIRYLRKRVKLLLKAYIQIGFYFLIFLRTTTVVVEVTSHYLPQKQES